MGRKTLLIDLDPQGNASTGLGASPRNRGGTTYDVIAGGEMIAPAAQRTGIENLHLLPASPDLSGLDIELSEDADRAYRLRNALLADSGGRDVVLIDCPPALSLLTVNAMTAANSVLVPLQCEFFAMEGLSQLLTTVERVKKGLNPDLTIDGIVLTMFDRRNRLSSQVAEDVRATLGDLVYQTVIPRNVRLSEAPSHALPALLYDHTCSGSQAYIALAGEFLRRGAGAPVAA